MTLETVFGIGVVLGIPIGMALQIVAPLWRPKRERRWRK